MSYTCMKPKGSCHNCKHFRFDEDYDDFACYGKYDLTSAQGLQIWLEEFQYINITLDQAKFINDFFEGHGYQLVRLEHCPNLLWRKDIEDQNQENEEYTYRDIIYFLDDNISTFEEGEQERLWKEFEALPKLWEA